MKSVLVGVLLVAMLSAQGCNALVSAVMYPRAGKFLRHSDAAAVFGIPMTLVDDSPDKYHPNVSSCLYKGNTSDGTQVRLRLDLAYLDADRIADVEKSWRYGKDSVEPKNLETLPGIGESAWIVPRDSGHMLLVRLSNCYFVLTTEGISAHNERATRAALVQLSRSIANSLATANG